jgi:lipid A 3-O-deacylase
MKLVCMLVLFCGLAGAQTASNPLEGQPWDFGIWGGGGFSVPGGTKDTHTINVGVRVGKVLTGDHGPGFLRGNFEWSADGVPVYYILQPARSAQNAYAAGFNPLNLKWNFTHSATTIPYLEIGGGVLFSNHQVPGGTNDVNFMTHAALGFHFFVRPKQALTLTTRYEHISNAGLATPNPGINTVQFTVGWNWFK